MASVERMRMGFSLGVERGSGAAPVMPDLKASPAAPRSTGRDIATLLQGARKLPVSRRSTGLAMLQRKMLTAARALVAGLALVVASATLAQDVVPAPDAPPVDDVAPRAGRVASFAGDLYLAPPDRAEEWAAIGLNYPVASGDNVWSAADGRAEVDYGGGQFRLGGDT